MLFDLTILTSPCTDFPLFLVLLLTPSFVAVIITKATQVHRLTTIRNINMVCNKLLPQTTLKFICDVQ